MRSVRLNVSTFLSSGSPCTLVKCIGDGIETGPSALTSVGAGSSSRFRLRAIGGGEIERFDGSSETSVLGLIEGGEASVWLSSMGRSADRSSFRG